MDTQTSPGPAQPVDDETLYGDPPDPRADRLRRLIEIEAFAQANANRTFGPMQRQYSALHDAAEVLVVLETRA